MRCVSEGLVMVAYIIISYQILISQKSKGEKLQKVSMLVNDKHIIVRDLLTQEKVNDIPVYR